MLKINRLRVEINTVKGVYGIDERFCSGLNFIASRENTCGKVRFWRPFTIALGLNRYLVELAGLEVKF